ncbi:MAG: hypothetical protein WC309_04550 [Candidatus Paceibacterota bacterium]|jgi:NAD+ kinase
MKIKILINIRKDWAKKLSREVAKYLILKGVSIVKKNADITLCIGGDGTIFYFNHKKQIEGSILAIGTKSSHLCQLKDTDWKEKIPYYLSGKKQETRITLSAKTGRKTYSAINDVVLHTADYRVISVYAKINNLEKNFEGDGIIISTPTGSTAYAYSAGGIIIDEKTEAIEVVPVCPYKRAMSPLIIHDSSKISFFSDRTADLTIDGIFIKKLKPKEKIDIEKGEKISFLV